MIPSSHGRRMIVDLSLTVLWPPAGSLWAGLSPPPYLAMENVTRDASAPNKHLSLCVTPCSQYEKRVIVFRMRQCA